MNSEKYMIEIIINETYKYITIFIYLYNVKNFIIFRKVKQISRIQIFKPVVLFYYL